MSDDPQSIPILAAVGRSLADWSGIELRLCSLFQAAADIPDLNKAQSIFDAIISFEVRLAIVDRMMSFENMDDIEAEMWARMSARLTKFYKKRHEIAHFTLLARTPPVISPFFTMEKWSAGSHSVLDERQISERGSKFFELFMAMGWFIARASERRKRGDKNPPLSAEEPPLVARLRELAIQTFEERKLNNSRSS